jgi:hypothetical protein
VPFTVHRSPFGVAWNPRMRSYFMVKATRRLRTVRLCFLERWVNRNGLLTSMRRTVQRWNGER